MKEPVSYKMKCDREHHRHTFGPTSYHMHDPSVIFDLLSLKEGDVFLDIGCGSGDYSIQALKFVGMTGKVLAFDKSESIINGLSEQIKSQGIKNMIVKQSDISKSLVIEDNFVDVCFIATVLHCLDLTQISNNIFNEIHRVLKPSGRLVIIECNINDASHGPPLDARISPDKLESLVIQNCFKKIKFIDLGFNYLMSFEKGYE